MGKENLEKEVRKAVETVRRVSDGKTLGALEAVVKVEDKGEGKIKIALRLPSSDAKNAREIEEACEEAAIAVSGVSAAGVEIEYKLPKVGGSDNGKPAAAPKKEVELTGVKNIIVVGSGKGGVGKSTVAANIAVGLAKKGLAVGLLDGDIYGPNQPMMFGISHPPDVISMDGRNMMVPIKAHGVGLMSVGFIVEEDKAMIWRGPILHGVIVQFLKDVHWDELDYLVVDLPPGTGDVQLSLAQSITVTGAVIVSTPQDLVMADVTRAKNMFDKLDIPVLGLVQNMSEFHAPDGKSYRIFAGPPAGAAARKMGISALGSLPIDPQVGVSSDGGTPILADDSLADSSVATEFRGIVDKLVDAVKYLKN